MHLSTQRNFDTIRRCFVSQSLRVRNKVTGRRCFVIIIQYHVDQQCSQLEAKSFDLQAVAVSGRTWVLREMEHEEGFDTERQRFSCRCRYRNKRVSCIHFRCSKKCYESPLRAKMTVSRNVETCIDYVLDWCCLSFFSAKGWSGPTLQLLASWSSGPRLNMSAKAAISKEVFIPHDEKMLAAVQVKRRTKKKIPFLATGGQGDYMTFICLSGQQNNGTLPFSSVIFSFSKAHTNEPFSI